MSNKIILGSVAGVAGIAIIKSVSGGQGITRIIAGAYIALLLLSLLDLFGGVWSNIAGGLALLTLVSAILLNFPGQQLAQITGTPSGVAPADTGVVNPNQPNSHVR